MCGGMQECGCNYCVFGKDCLLGSMTIISRLLLCLVKDHLFVGLFVYLVKGSLSCASVFISM